jgi:hypothetical protein
LQENLKNLSTRGRRIIAKGSGHNITLERPDVIEREVPVFVAGIGGNEAQVAAVDGGAHSSR